MRLRIRYAKLGKVRFTSHRDTARIWERAMRRAGLRVASSCGFTPRPRISFGLALPTGAESIAEYLDVELDGELDVAVDDLTDALPVGFTTLAAAEVTTPGALQEIVTSVRWELAVPEGLAAAAAADRLLAASELPIERERKGTRRIDDVRPQILSLAVADDDARMVADVATVGRGLRPIELATVAFPDADHATLLTIRATRTHQWIDDDGGRREVLALPAAVMAPAMGA